MVTFQHNVMKKGKDFNKRKADIEPVGSAIEQLLNVYKLKGRFDQKKLINSWNDLMGTAIANKTGKIFIKKDVLFVEIDSAPLKHELNMQKNKVMELIRKEAGENVIKEIIFM